MADPTGPEAIRVVAYIIAAILLAFALSVLALESLALTSQPAASPIPYFGDLNIYRSAVSFWVHGGGLYDYAYSNPLLPAPLGFTYPPFAALLLAPIAWVPMGALTAVWTASTFVLVGILSTLLARRSGASCLSAWPARARVFALGAASAAALLLSYPVFHDLGVGQVSVAITALALLDAAGIGSGRRQGLLIGLAAAVKLTPLVFIPYFLMSRQRRPALVASGAFVGATGLAWAVSPRTSIMYWGSLVADTSRVGLIAWPRNKSLMGLLSRLGVSGAALEVLWMALGLALALVALHRSRVHHERGEEVEAGLVMGSLSVVVSPISWPHHQAWAVMTGLWLVFNRPAALRALGIALLAGFSLVSPFANPPTPMGLGMRFGAELPTLSFIAIAVLGLGRSTARRVGGRDTHSQPTGCRHGSTTFANIRASLARHGSSEGGKDPGIEALDHWAQHDDSHDHDHGDEADEQAVLDHRRAPVIGAVQRDAPESTA